MKHSLTRYTAVALMGFLMMGAGSCEDHPDVVGDWNADCTFTNPASTHKYYWTFGADNGTGQTEFHQWETLADGTVEDFLSFYIYQGPSITISNPLQENSDRIFLVLDAGPDKLSFVGAEYKCVLEKTTDVHP